MAFIEDLGRKLPCARCEALPTEDCRTITGNKASRLHTARIEPLLTASDFGFFNGLGTAVDFIERRCDPDKADLEPRATLEKAIADLRAWQPPPWVPQ